MTYKENPKIKKGRRVLPKLPSEEVREIYICCPGCGQQYLLQEEETMLPSLDCITCGLIILLNKNNK